MPIVAAGVILPNIFSIRACLLPIPFMVVSKTMHTGAKCCCENYILLISIIKITFPEFNLSTGENFLAYNKSTVEVPVQIFRISKC
jgi:hypothetical protein